MIHSLSLFSLFFAVFEVLDGNSFSQRFRKQYHCLDLSVESLSQVSQYIVF